MELRDKILEIVRDASGGIKFTELCCKLAATGISYDSTEVERVICEAPELAMLEYTHELAPQHHRWKGFVYIKPGIAPGNIGAEGSGPPVGPNVRERKGWKQRSLEFEEKLSASHHDRCNGDRTRIVGNPGCDCRRTLSIEWSKLEARIEAALLQAEKAEHDRNFLLEGIRDALSKSTVADMRIPLVGCMTKRLPVTDKDRAWAREQIEREEGEER